MEPRGRRAADRATGALARVLTRIFFRRVEIAGGDLTPQRGPLVQVANHHNGLVDGVVLIAASRRYPRFLGKSTLWKLLPLRPLLALAGVVPVYRSSDVAGVLSDDQRFAANRAALDRGRRVLAGGGSIGVFPEGISHDLTSLQGLQGGAARVALGAADAGAPDVAIQPVGITYDDKTRFRSRVLARFGPPRPVGPYLADYRKDPGAAARRLTVDLAADLRAVGPEFPTVELAERCQELAAIAAATWAQSGPAPGRFVDEERLARRLAQRAAEPGGAEEVFGLDRRRRIYQAGLDRLGLDDHQLVAAASSPPARIPGAGRPVRAAITAVISGVGIGVHIIPYAAIAVVGRLPRNRGMRATVKLFGSLFVYNLVYLTLGVVVGRRRGWKAGVVAVVAAPSSGWVALRALEEADDAGDLRRVVRTIRSSGDATRRLAEERAALVGAVLTIAGR